MKPDQRARDEGRLRDMLTYAREAVGFAEGQSRADLESDSLRELAIERATEIVGEAAKNVSDVYKAEHPQIPWRDIIRTRDLFAHAYFKINTDAVWEIVTVSLPELIAELEKIVDEGG